MPLYLFKVQIYQVFFGHFAVSILACGICLIYSLSFVLN